MVKDLISNILVEQSRKEYMAAIYGAAAMAHMTMIIATDAIDRLEEECPHLIKYKVLGSISAIKKENTRLTKAISQQLREQDDAAWMADFGNSMYGVIEPDINKLHVAISNYLGRYPGIKYRHVFALILIAQAIASDAKSYVDKVSRKFIRYNVYNKAGEKCSAQANIQSLSCAAINHRLSVMADALLKPCVSGDIDLLTDNSIRNGCEIIINKLADPKAWGYAMQQAKDLNNND